MSRTRASCFIRGSRDLETIKALGLRPRAFICFSVSGTPDETLALVFDILHHHHHHHHCIIILYRHRFYLQLENGVLHAFVKLCRCDFQVIITGRRGKDKL